jgi:hypothetical protein
LADSLQRESIISDSAAAGLDQLHVGRAQVSRHVLRGFVEATSTVIVAVVIPISAAGLAGLSGSRACRLRGLLGLW